MDVAEVAGGALGAALEAAAGDDAATDPGRHLDEDQVVDVGQVGLPLAEGHDVDVVVDEHGDGEVLLEEAGDVVPVPAGHDRRVDRTAGGVLDGTGQADADRGQVVGASRAAAQQRPDRRDHPAEDDLGALDDVDLRGDLGEQRAGEVAEHGPGVRGADVDAHHDPRGRVEGEERGWPAAGGLAPAEGGDEAQPHQRVDARGHRRAGQSGGLGELGTGPRTAVPQQLEDVTGAHGGQ